jgi:hypothetical protein
MERKTTPDILGNVLGLVVDDAAITVAQLRYDYSQLGAIGPQVQQHAVALKGFERKANEAVIEAGRRLIAVKAALQHGQWGDWLAVEFGMTDRTARTMMAIAERFDGENGKFSDLNSSVLGLLASPSVPDAAVEAVAQVAAEEGRVSVTRAKQIIQHQKFLDRQAAQRNDAAEDVWRPAQDTPATLPPLKRAGESDVYAVLDVMAPTCDIETVDPAWRLDYVESALLRADKQMRRDLIVDCIDDWLRNRKLRHGIEDAPSADPYHHADGDAIRNDLAAQDAARIATADVAFGMATDKGAAQYAMLLEAVADALPEIAKLTGKTIDVSVLKAALRPVHDALLTVAVAPPPAAPAAALPADLVAHGWELHTMRGKHYASVSVLTEDEPIRTQLRADIGDAIRDAQYLHKNLHIGVSA